MPSDRGLLLSAPCPLGLPIHQYTARAGRAVGAPPTSHVDGAGLQPGRRAAEGCVGCGRSRHAFVPFLIVLEDAEVVDGALGRESSGAYRQLPATDEASADQRGKSESGEAR